MQQSYAEQYRDLYESHWWWRAREAFVLHHVDRLYRPGWSAILDIGCGDALLFPRLSRYGDVYGIEADRQLLAHSGGHRDRIEICAFGPHYRSPRRFDLILMLDVLEHLQDDGGSLRAAQGLLQPEGFLLLTVPALPSLWSQHDEVNRHYRRYTRTSLRATLNRTGLEMVQCRYFFFWTILPMLARRWRYPAGGRQPAPPDDYSVKVPPEWLSKSLYQLCRAEHRGAGWLGGVIGTSLLAVLRPHPIRRTNFQPVEQVSNLSAQRISPSRKNRATCHDSDRLPPSPVLENP